MLFRKKPDEIAGKTERLAGPLPATEPPPRPCRAHAGSPIQSVIDAWLTIAGSLESQGDVRVEGHITGDIRCASLVIGRDAVVSGDIVAEEAVVRGRVKGTIRANRVILLDTACVESAIYHRVLCVDEGASFDGQSCHRQQPHQEEEASVQVIERGQERTVAAPAAPHERPNRPATNAGVQVAEA